MIQDKIYQYFERDPELKVLFIFNNEFPCCSTNPHLWGESPCKHHSH